MLAPYTFIIRCISLQEALQLIYFKGVFQALMWEFCAKGVSLNVMLFLFNVFFPMYPADGAKILTTSLMYFWGTVLSLFRALAFGRTHARIPTLVCQS